MNDANHDLRPASEKIPSTYSDKEIDMVPAATVRKYPEIYSNKSLEDVTRFTKDMLLL